ncbi:peptidoglycan editing factor PgeF [Salirhabdus salicampi]|uniref:peptidoglycan editing factor PgeF n=1 Tax=Salirhabdus salicampi TaxID=476102 RepID=UPI0020C28413|nr:peptidoglycan editing factor PgeF [Salirhabdus salicampi]MCP8616591.1 peptidoglycan editing factor PgeF [Salirhabdus salicampi]
MQEPFQKCEAPSLLSINAWKQYGIIGGMTTRNGGVSPSPFDELNLGFHVNDDRNHVEHNRFIVADLLATPTSDWVGATQVHGTDVLNVTSDTSLPSTAQYDGFITNVKGKLLTCLYADCVPLFFAAPSFGWIGLAHAGWRGTVNGIGRKVIELLQQQGVSIEDIQIVIGPSIGKRYYEVDEHVMSHIPKRYWQEPVVSKVDDTHWLLDLKGLHKSIFITEGLRENQIQMTSFCTYEHKHLFYSHRRDQGKTGRMMAYIRLQ